MFIMWRAELNTASVWKFPAEYSLFMWSSQVSFPRNFSNHNALSRILKQIADLQLKTMKVRKEKSILHQNLLLWLWHTYQLNIFLFGRRRDWGNDVDILRKINTFKSITHSLFILHELLHQTFKAASKILEILNLLP